MKNAQNVVKKVKYETHEYKSHNNSLHHTHVLYTIKLFNNKYNCLSD